MKTVLLLVCVSLFVVCCGQIDANEARQPTASLTATVAPAGKPAPLDKVTLRLDWFYSSSHAPFFLGIEKGWYEESGIDLALTEGKGSGSVIQLVGNGTDTFGYATSDTVIRGVQSGITVRSVATIMPKTSDSVMVLASSAITHPDQLRGKSIAVIPGSAAEVLLPEFLAGAGLSLDDVSVVSMDAALKNQALLQGKVDGVTQPAFASSVFEPAGGANVFHYSDYGITIVGYGLVTRLETIEDDPSLVRRFVHATLRAWEYALDHQEEALQALQHGYAEQSSSERIESDAQSLPYVLELVKPAVPGMPLGFHSAEDWEAMQNLLIRYDIVDARRPVTDYMTSEFVMED